MRKLMTAILAATIAVLPMAFVPAANAADPVTVSNGMRWTVGANPGPGEWCSIGAVGTSEGKQVGITAAHCAANLPVGSPIYLYDNLAAGPVGTLGARDLDVDYQVMNFDPAKVKLTSRLLDGVASAKPGQWAIRLGGTIPFALGPVLNVEPTRIYTLVIAGPGDSGGTIMVNNKFVGITRDVSIKGFGYVNFDAIKGAVPGFTVAPRG